MKTNYYSYAAHFALTLFAVIQAPAQCTTEWPLVYGTPAQTRFADISYPGPGQGILWRDPFCVGVHSPSIPVLANGVVIFGTSGVNSQSAGTRFVDARTGRLVYVSTLPGLSTRQAVGEVVLDGQSRRLAFLATLVPTPGSGPYKLIIAAHDLAAMPADPTAPWSPVWQNEDLTVPSGFYLNFCGDCGNSDAALFLCTTYTLYKFQAATGNLEWSTPVGNSQASFAVGEIGGGASGTRRIVITAGTSGVFAWDAGTGQNVWGQTGYGGKDPSIVATPAGAHRVVVPVWVPTGRKNPARRPGLICLDADNGGAIIPPWPITLYPDSCNPANAPAAVRYLYDGSGQITDVGIYHTPGSGQPSQTDHPFWALKLDGTSAWPAGVPNPIPLPSGTWNQATVTRDHVLLPIGNGDLFSVDLNSGATFSTPFELDYTAVRNMAVSLNDGQNPIFYTYSQRLGLMAIVPGPVHNMSITSCSLPDTVPGGQPLTISVTVENLGNYTETTTVALEVNGSTLASSAIEASNPRATNSFICNWTPARSSSSYTTPVSVKVAAVADEVGIYDNEITKTVTVLPTDVVTITSAYWVQSKRQLQVEATSSSPRQAVLTLYYPDKATDTTPNRMSYFPSRGVYIYTGNEPIYSKTVYVESSLGGSATFTNVGLHPR